MLSRFCRPFLPLRRLRCVSVDARQSLPPLSCNQTVSLATRYTAPIHDSKTPRPLVVCLHGLDNWKGTWETTSAILSRRGLASLAVDLRGHGESPLGHMADFTPKVLAADVRKAMRSAQLLDSGTQVVLVGHSMGGRVALRYAAEFPEDITAVVIEDMECVPRYWMRAGLPNAPPMFSQDFDSVDACIESLRNFGYGIRDIHKWLSEEPPRISIRENGKVVWSAVNPTSRYLGIKHILDSMDGYEALKQLGRMHKERSNACNTFVLVAEHGVCSWDSKPGGLHDMLSIHPSLTLKEFRGAAHSIHTTQAEHFVDFIEEIASCNIHLSR